ncbi:MAG: hypothetical protein A4E62_01783 [Syntrophorhabdus sp. PtaU1.Bin002]|nr:MAG: hypothetical protein A4E62_01783 [Syntrophorhabdus sp. PtaU1.Bin002]
MHNCTRICATASRFIVCTAGYGAMETNNKQQPHNLHVPEKILIYVVLLVLLSIAFFVTILVL